MPTILRRRPGPRYGPLGADVVTRGEGRSYAQVRVERLRAAHRAVVLIRDELAPLGARQLAARHATGVLRPGVGIDLPALGIAAVTEYEQLPAVRREPGADPAERSRERSQRAARRDVPQDRVPVACRRGEHPPVGGELRAEHAPLVPGQASAGAATARDVPQLRVTLMGRDGEQSAIG